MISFMQGYAEFSSLVCSVYFNDSLYFLKNILLLIFNSFKWIT